MEVKGRKNEGDGKRRVESGYGILTTSRANVHYVIFFALLMAIVLPCRCEAQYESVSSLSEEEHYEESVTSYSGPDSYAQATSYHGFEKSNVDDIHELIGNFLTWTSSIYQSISSLQQPPQGSALSMFREDFAKTEYDVCWKGADIDFLIDHTDFSLMDLYGKVGVFELTSARRKNVHSGPLHCHLCYVQTGAFQQTASRLRGHDELIFITVLQHSHDWGRTFTDNCKLWVRDDPNKLPAVISQSSYMILNGNEEIEHLASLLNLEGNSPHYFVIDCRPCSGGPFEEEVEGKEGCFLRAVVPDVWNPSIFFTTIRDAHTQSDITVERWLNELPPPACG